MPPGSVAHFNSTDLETGNLAKGLSGGIGAGQGHRRLELASEADLDVLASTRTTDGFVTSMHDTVPLTSGSYPVPIFNPGSNRAQVSLLRLVNPGSDLARVEVTASTTTVTVAATSPLRFPHDAPQRSPRRRSKAARVWTEGWATTTASGAVRVPLPGTSHRKTG